MQDDIPAEFMTPPEEPDTVEVETTPEPIIQAQEPEPIAATTPPQALIPEQEPATPEPVKPHMSEKATYPVKAEKRVSKELTDVTLTGREERFAELLAYGKNSLRAYSEAFQIAIPETIEDKKKLKYIAYGYSCRKSVVERVTELRDVQARRTVMTIAQRKALLIKAIERNAEADPVAILNGAKPKRGTVSSAAQDITGRISSVRVNGLPAVLAAIKELNLMEGVYDQSGPKTEFQIALQAQLVAGSVSADLPVAASVQPAFTVYQPATPPVSGQGDNAQDPV